jgi:hypothetical protein
MFYHLRIRLGLAQRDIPETISGTLHFLDGTRQKVEAKPEELPAYLVLPVFPSDPGIFLPPGYERRRTEIITKVMFEPSDRSKLLGADEVETQLNLNFEKYQRMIAKIALGFAILKFGPRTFDPLVCDFILGKERAPDKYVFCPPHEKTGQRYGFNAFHPAQETHALQARERIIAGRRYLVAWVRLFSAYGAPSNGVVVGIFK